MMFPGTWKDNVLANDLKFECVAGRLSRSGLTELSVLNEDLFGLGETPDALERFFNECRDLLFVFCRSNHTLVGFKVGMYAEAYVFDSWRGGVHPNLRRRGIARRLTRMQHNWCRAHGYQRIQTVTNQENEPMLNLNRAMGFSLVRTFVNEQGAKKVLQSRTL